MTTPDLRTQARDAMAIARADLERLIRIPSVAFEGFAPEPVHAAAAATAEILGSAGLGDVRLLDTGGYPAVFGELPAPAGTPTVLLYAHYDVQPAGPEELWDTPPFEPVVRDGRLFGRGTSDDKSGIVLHASVLRMFRGRVPVGVKVLVEGEEEASTEHLPQLIDGNRDLLAADVVVVADSGNVKTGEPTLATSARGVVSCTVDVRALEMPVHSGSYGGAAPDALVALIRMLAALHDARGNVAVPGLGSMRAPEAGYPEEQFRREAGVLPGAELVGDGPLPERLWGRPAVNVIGLDAPPVHGARNILVDHARAQVSLRVAPGDDPERAIGLVADHLRAAAPWGVDVSIEPGEAGRGFVARDDGPAYAAARASMEQAYGRPATTMGSGGSVPLIPALANALPDAEILFLGAMDDRSNAHAQNESVDLAELERATLAEALLLATLAGASRA
jgi:acetylornithine deacetylase/succinyl-diaminopimelate desuccinylase-like protein